MAVKRRPAVLECDQRIFSAGKHRNIVLTIDPVSSLVEVRLKGERTRWLVTVADVWRLALTTGEKERLNV